MREEIIVADSSPLVGLARIGQLGMLPRLARRVVVPAHVWEEVTWSRTAPGAEEILAQSWFEILSGDKERTERLFNIVDRGEAEAIALAEGLPDALLLIDERKGRRVAESLGLRKVGTLGLLVMAKEAGLIERIRPLIEELSASNIYIRKELAEAILARMGE